MTSSKICLSDVLNRTALAILLLLFYGIDHATAQSDIFVNHQQGEYTLQMNLQVAGDVQPVIDILTDFDHLDVLSSAIESSTFLGTDPQGASLVQTVISDCILFFCKTMGRVEKVIIADNGRITAEVIPEQSDFSYGQSEWVVSRLGDQVSIRYQARLVPKFSVPAGIGPMMIKYVMRRELRQMAEILQRAQ